MFRLIGTLSNLRRLEFISRHRENTFPIREIVIKEVASAIQELRAIALGQDRRRMINYRRANRNILPIPRLP